MRGLFASQSARESVVNAKQPTWTRFRITHGASTAPHATRPAADDHSVRRVGRQNQMSSAREDERQHRQADVREDREPEDAAERDRGADRPALEQDRRTEQKIAAARRPSRISRLM